MLQLTVHQSRKKNGCPSERDLVKDNYLEGVLTIFFCSTILVEPNCEASITETGSVLIKVNRIIQLVRSWAVWLPKVAGRQIQWLAIKSAVRLKLGR
jgi:hypothetical protein